MIERERPSSPTNDKYGSICILIQSCRRSLYVGLYVSYFSASHKPISYPSLSSRCPILAHSYTSTQNQLVAITKKFVTLSYLYPHPAAILPASKPTVATDTTLVSSSRTLCHIPVNKSHTPTLKSPPETDSILALTTGNLTDWYYWCSLSPEHTS